MDREDWIAAIVMHVERSGCVVLDDERARLRRRFTRADLALIEDLIARAAHASEK